MRGTTPSAVADAHRARARSAAESGRAGEALQYFRALLEAAPDDAEALNYIAVIELSAGRVAEAGDLLRRALLAHPDDVPTLKNKGLLLLRTGQLDEAEQAFRGLVKSDPDFFVARLYLGVVLERRGNARGATVEYFSAVSKAQSMGYWTSPATTPPGIRPMVEHAMVAARNGRSRLLAAVLAPLKERFGAGSLERVERCLASHLGPARATPPDSRQKPQFLYFPDLPSEPVLSRELFPWYPELEAATDAIREELLAVLGDRPQLEPFLGEPPPGMKSSYLGGHGESDTPRWDAYFFYRHGRTFEENVARCPRTVEALDRAPIVRIRQHAPEALFSVLGPGSHILPHHGVTNTRVVTHLPLIVPPDCRLRVADHLHAWESGRCFTFDDTFEHEAWNKGTATRVILLFDVWNPHLTGVEQIALAELVAAMGDLDVEAM
jgi:aspartate beta-hydroxylase